MRTQPLLGMVGESGFIVNIKHSQRRLEGSRLNGTTKNRLVERKGEGGAEERGASRSREEQRTKRTRGNQERENPESMWELYRNGKLAEKAQPLGWRGLG